SGGAPVGIPDRIGFGAAGLDGHERLWRLAFAFCDLLHRTAGGNRAIVLEDRLSLPVPGIFVAVFYQQPVGPAAAVAIMAHAHQNPASVQLVALQREFQIALLEALFRIVGVPGAAIP